MPPGELESFRGSLAAEALGTEGWIVVEELHRDLGGGDEEEAVVVEGRLLQGPEPEELRLSIWRPTEAGWELLARGEEVPGREVGLLRIGSCGGEARLLFAALEPEPDQLRHRLWIYAGLPELRKTMGVQRDVDAAGQSGFFAVAEGFGFRAGEAEERWLCQAGRYVQVEPTSGAEIPLAP